MGQLLCPRELDGLLGGRKERMAGTGPEGYGDSDAGGAFGRDGGGGVTGSEGWAFLIENTELH